MLYKIGSFDFSAFLLFILQTGLLWSLHITSTSAQTINVTCETQPETILETQAILTANCPSGCLETSFPVYGSMVYAGHSSLCRSAIHGGWMTDSGGYVTAQNVTALPDYAGSFRNSISSQAIGAYPVAYILREDFNECVEETDNCDPNANCRNTNGSFTCSCKNGFLGDGIQCTDVNECSNGADNCHPNYSNCTNVPGSFVCSCKDGFTGNGTHCSDIDECSTGILSCHENATCTNMIGSSSCKCNSGYVGNGTICEDLNECEADVDDCNFFATCFNVPGSYNCSCVSGFFGSGFLCSSSTTTRYSSHVTLTFVAVMFRMYIS